MSATCPSSLPMVGPDLVGAFAPNGRHMRRPADVCESALSTSRGVPPTMPLTRLHQIARGADAVTSNRARILTRRRMTAALAASMIALVAAGLDRQQPITAHEVVPAGMSATTTASRSEAFARQVTRTVAPQRAQPVATGPQDWPTYLHDVARSSATSESILSTANVPTLVQQWSHATGGVVAASPAIVNGVVYVGSWDGNEYALNGSTGAVIWQTALGTTTDPPCVPPHLGVTSSATVINGVVYVGGGDAYWYALDANTGAVLWRVYTGDNSQAGAHYNWSSPLIYGNSAYIGIASNCDAPLVQGELLRVDLTTHQVVATAKFVPDGQVGGGVWTSPTLDPATNTVFVSTGTLNLYSQTLSQAVVSLDATTLNIKDHWQLPFEAAVSDSDWGTTPTLTVDSHGRQLVSLANKNGILYTLQRNNLAAGPVWQYQLAFGGDCPYCGDGTISSGVFANGTLYYAAGSNLDSKGIGHAGSVSAFDPGTGQRLWYHATDQTEVGSIVGANGVIFVPDGNIVEALDAATGYAIWTYKIAGGTYAAPAVSHGRVYVGSLDGSVHAFGLPPSSPPPPPADANCPTGFTCQDIGSAKPGREVVNPDGSVTVHGSGTGSRGPSDQMRIVTEPVTGDFQVSVEIMGQTGGVYPGWMAPQAGIVVRQSADPTAPYYGALMDPTYPNENENQPNLIMFYRDTWGTHVIELTQDYPQPYPRWIMVQRHDDTFQTLSSADGVHYVLIGGTVHTLVMPTRLLAGVAVSSGSATSMSAATYRNIAVGPPTQTYTRQASTHPCPTSWSCEDIGVGSPIGDQTLAGGVWTIQGSAPGIAGAVDQFHYVFQRTGGDGTVTGRLTSVGNSSPTAQAALLMRADDTQQSTYYGVVVNPGGTATVQWREHNGIKTRTTVPLPTQTLPAWFRISRYTDTAHTPVLTYYSTLTSSDGITWSQVNGSTVALDLGSNPLAGMGGSSNANRTLNPSTWDSVVVSSQRIPPPGICPPSFACQDIGQGYMPGSQMYSNGTWTFNAGGSDIWDVYDMFHFAYQPLAADGTVSARVVSVAKASYDDEYEKAGVMVRQTTDPQSPYYGVFQTPQHGVAVQWRSAQAGQTSQILIPGPQPAYPIYLMIGRWTDPHPGGSTYYTAYTSTDNKTFTAVPGSTMPLTMSGSLLAGIAADSYQEKFTLAVTFDNFALFNTEPIPPGACPTSMAGCADIGGAAPAGSQTLSGNTLTMQAGGGDIWSTADQLHMDWQSLAADGVVSARVVSQQNTGPWAKAGVLMRASTAAGSPYYGVFMTPSNGVAIQYRTSAGGTTAQILVSGTTPDYLQVSRYTDANQVTWYTAFTSPDGTNWNQVGGSTVAISMPGSILAGWGANSYSQTVSSQVVFDALSVTNGSSPPAGLCPAGWTCADLGGATPAGGQNLSGSTWTLQGGGGDIWGTADQFRMAWQSLAADGTVTARTASLTPTNPWTKAGVMVRATTDTASPYYALLVTPQNGIVVQFRTTSGATTSQIALPGAAPVWVRVARYTDATGPTPVTYYTAYTSSDGTTWSQVGGSTVAMSMPGALLAGLVITSHDTTHLATAVMDNVAIATAAAAPAGICPGAWTCADIGGATPAGGQTNTGATWTVTAGGGDIADPTDEYRSITQSLPADGTVSAHVASQTNTNAWAKAGVMVRASSDPTAPYYGIFVTPSQGVMVQYRSTLGGTTAYPVVGSSGGAPLYVQITRTGTTFAAATSSDGHTWTPLPGSTVAIPALSGALAAGLAASSHDTTHLMTVVYDTVVIGPAH